MPNKHTLEEKFGNLYIQSQLALTPQKENLRVQVWKKKWKTLLNDKPSSPSK